MGKKGKKKGKNAEDNESSASSQASSPPQPPAQQQRQGQEVSIAQATAGMAQLSTGGQGQTPGSSGQQRAVRSDNSGQQPKAGMGRGRGRGKSDQREPQMPIPGMSQPARVPGMPQPAPGGQPKAWGPSGATARGSQDAAGGQSTQQYVPGMPQTAPGGQPKAWGPSGATAGGQSTQQYVPGMPQTAPGGQPKAWGPPGATARGSQDAAGGQSTQQYVPGMPPPAQKTQRQTSSAGSTGPSPQQTQRQSSAPSAPGSSASSAAGDTASVGSSKSGPKKKESPISSAAAGTSPVKTSLSPAQQATYRNQIPKRKNPNKGGTAGRPITVETNMIPMTFGKNFKPWVTHYDVKFDPDKPKFMYRPVVEAVRLRHFPNRYPAFDGRCNVFSAGNLPFGDHFTTEVQVFNPQRQLEMTFKVTLAKSQDIDMSWLLNVKPGLEETEREQIAIQALDVVLRSAPNRHNAITVGRSFFTQPEKGQVLDLGNGMDLWVGTFQSAVLGWKPYFNIDVAHKAFPKNQSVLDLMKDLLYGDPRSNCEIKPQDVEYGKRKLQLYLKGLKVTYEIPGIPSSRRTMGINDLGKSSRDATFEMQDGTVTTVLNYFAREKRYKIRNPDLPTLWVGSKNKTVLIPAELCVIEAGQVTNRKLDERQTATMIKYAATNTATRKKKIMEGFAKMKFNEDPAMKEFGISLGGGFETVKARVLNPPSLFDKRDILVKRGVWKANSFHTAMVLPDRSWTILNLNDRTQEGPLRIMVEKLRSGGRAVGMNIGEPLTPFKHMRAPFRDVREIIQFFNQKKKEELKLIIVVVPDKTGPVYGKVKQVAELNVGVLTQCIKAITVERKMNEATAGNILLKINSKLNGTNQIFAVGKNPPCLNRPCMIVGADVTHPSPDSVGIPSIAAVAASHGPRAFKYNVKIRLQPPKTEIILNLDEIMKQQLIFFYRSTGHKPERIIFYRDGVSEGQFPQVMHHELQAIRNACKRVAGDGKYEPKITFLVVQKRHHIRLFPTDGRNSDDKNFNVQAGTVVDTDITHPSHIDFYLVSHASIQGTARPTKYRCLWDDSDMSEDEIEQLTYYLCHMFSRCTRSVSYPAPTYYAHLAAFRARALTNEVDIHLNNLDEEQRTKMTIKPEILLENPMFFV